MTPTLAVLALFATFAALPADARVGGGVRVACPDADGHAMAEVRVDILTDDYPQETSWRLINSCAGDAIQESVAAGTVYQAQRTGYSDVYCVPTAEYRFSIVDAYGDGMCCGYGSGSYSVAYNGEVKAAGGAYHSSETSTFGSCGSPNPTPPPTDGPTDPPPTDAPTPLPTADPTLPPTPLPATVPTDQPTQSPTISPTPGPTGAPTPLSTKEPTVPPSLPSTHAPTDQPTTSPTLSPTPVDRDDRRRRRPRENTVVNFSRLAVKWVELSERGPTISSHFMVHVTATLFDAYAAFERRTTGAIADLDDGVRAADYVFLPGKFAAARLHAMASAAHDVITALGRTLLDQKYLEIENGENATERLAELLRDAAALRADVVEGLALDGAPLAVAESVAAAVSSAVLARVREDRSNYQEDFRDYTGYAVRPMFEPVPVITDPRTDYNFLDGSWVETFNTYDAVAANQVPNPGFAQVHPLVESGDVTLTQSYQSLTQHGIFPGDADGGEQFPLTAHWGYVKCFSLDDPSALHTPVFGPYDDQGDLNEEWVQEARELLDLALKQQDTNCPECRAESEYWELGDEFAYPPGWWIERATDIASAENMNMKKSLQLIFGVSMTVFDAGVAAWGMKYEEDTVRPVTTINELFKGSEVGDWRGNRTATIDDKDLWRPYQLRRNIVPPFPDIPSGHSAFSTSASVVLRNLLGTNVFDYTTEPFNSRFDLDDGFDGDPANGNEDTVLNWKTLSQAADAAGFSRLLGGIHMMQGNMIGLEMGARVGHSTLKHLRHLFGDNDLGQDPVEDIFEHIVTGTGQDDALLVAPCVQDSPVEVYGFYGNDVLVFSDSGVCGPVSLFGGDGMDIFRVGAMVTVQDYESHDTIEILQEEGPISTSISDSVTTVFVNNNAVLMVDGVWSTNELNIIFGHDGDVDGDSGDINSGDNSSDDSADDSVDVDDDDDEHDDDHDDPDDDDNYNYGDDTNNGDADDNDGQVLAGIFQ